VVAPPLLFHLVEQGACQRDAPWSCLLADGQPASRIYFVDSDLVDSEASRRWLEALRARLGAAPALERELPTSRILRFDPR